MNIAMILAGGSGKRMGQYIPKQFLTVNDKPVIAYTMEAFENHPQIGAIVVVSIEGWERVVEAYAHQFGISKLKCVVAGGDNGQSSIRNGLFAMEKLFSADDLILIHDGIRPCVSPQIITDCIETAQKYGNAVTAVPCAEAMIQTEDGQSSTGSYPRERLKRTQTPQAFYLGEMCQLHRDALEAGITDSVASCTLMIEMGKKIFFAPGSEKNLKLTTVDDIDIFKALLTAGQARWLKR